MPRKVTFPPHPPHTALDPIVCVPHAPKECSFKRGPRVLHIPMPRWLISALGTLHTGIPREKKEASATSTGGCPPSAGPLMDQQADPHLRGCVGSSGPSHGGPASPDPPSVNEADVLFQLRRGGSPASLDGGQPTRAAVLKLSCVHPSKASDGHNDSYLQSATAFTAWDPTGLYKCNKLRYTLTRRRLSPTPARRPPPGRQGAAVLLHGAPGHNGQAREGRMAGAGRPGAAPGRHTQPVLF